MTKPIIFIWYGACRSKLPIFRSKIGEELRCRHAVRPVLRRGAPQHRLEGAGEFAAVVIAKFAGDVRHRPGGAKQLRGRQVHLIGADTLVEGLAIDALGAAPELLRGYMEPDGQVLGGQALVPVVADKGKHLLEQLGLALGAGAPPGLELAGVQTGQKEQKLQYLDLEIALPQVLRDGVEFGKEVGQPGGGAHDEIPLRGAEFPEQGGQVHLHITEQAGGALGASAGSMMTEMPW